MKGKLRWNEVRLQRPYSLDRSGGVDEAEAGRGRGLEDRVTPETLVTLNRPLLGVDDGPNGHVGLWLGNGMIVQCSSSGDGSNIRPLAGYVAPTGWVRWGL